MMGKCVYVAAAVIALCLCVGDASNLLRPDIALTPRGLKFAVQDNGYRLVAFHMSVNKDVVGTAGGDINVDITTKTGSDWVYVAPVQLQAGDTVHYWVYAILNTGGGRQLLDQSWTYDGSGGSDTGTGGGSDTGTGGGSDTGTGGGSDTGTGGGSDTGTGGGSDTGTGGSSDTGTGGGSDTGTGGGSDTGTGGGSDTGTGGGNNGGSGRKVGPGISEGFVDSEGCTSYPCVIFNDDFDFLNHRVWEHEITANGGGNWEFQFYTNNRSNSYTRDGVLYIKPTLTSDHYGMGFLEHGTLDLWGHLPSDMCTGNSFYGCKRVGSPGKILNPIQSARLRTSRGFNFRYGKIEVEAQMPAGDWIWPAIWMMPRLSVYGGWPASGEIDIMESRGNRNYVSRNGESRGVDTVGSTMHYGPDWQNNRWYTAHASKKLSSGTFADGFHNFSVQWDENSISFGVDQEVILTVDPGPGGFWEYGGLDRLSGRRDNPWRGASKMAPFDQEFYLILNVAVGGVNGYFSDGLINSPYPKPWSDGAGNAPDQFWAARDRWYPTWHPNRNNGEDAALKVNRVTVWKVKADPQ